MLSSANVHWNSVKVGTAQETHFSKTGKTQNSFGLLLSHQQSVGTSHTILIDFSLTVKAATLIFISGRGSAISSAKQGISGSIYNLVKN